MLCKLFKSIQQRSSASQTDINKRRGIVASLRLRLVWTKYGLEHGISAYRKISASFVEKNHNSMSHQTSPSKGSYPSQQVSPLNAVNSTGIQAPTANFVKNRQGVCITVIIIMSVDWSGSQRPFISKAVAQRVKWPTIQHERVKWEKPIYFIIPYDWKDWYPLGC